RNINQLIHIHPILYIFIFLSFVTGTMTQLFILLSIVIIHEFGHFFAARYFHWNIEKITIWVFGAVMETSEYRIRKIHEDLLVTLAGPAQHVLIFFCLFGLKFVDFIPSTIVELGLTYNYILLIFNLLPIYPLDGGKIFFYILSYFYPYLDARIFVILFSLLSCLLFI